MSAAFATRLDAFSGWRSALSQRVDEVARLLVEHDLADAGDAAATTALRTRLDADKLVVAFVAEFSRGKSELINAIFFADTGRRVLPATPGRTTMCPVELGFDEAEPVSLRLLPIETRRLGLSLAEARSRPELWTNVTLPLGDAARLARSMQQVTRTRAVERDEARELGFWDDARPADNPPLDAAGRLLVPAWRHALINYPHPLLRQGLVVLDTPGLNAIGAEPELTLSLLPTAHATVFVLGADTGVTRSDLHIWRDQLATHAPTRYAVLNKIDALRDPLAPPAQVDEQITAQCAESARLLEIAPERVFPLSARQALAARVLGDSAALADSRLPAFEGALGAQLLPQRRDVLQRMALDCAAQLENASMQRLGDRRRQIAEQMLELRGLRGKSTARLRVMLQRVDAEAAEFEQCGARLQAVRSIHARMHKEVLLGLAPEALHDEVNRMQSHAQSSLLGLGARKAFAELCARLARRIEAARRGADEMREMLGASHARLNAEFGFALAPAAPPDLAPFAADLALIEASYTKYLGLKQALRLAQPKVMDQFRRMLVSKLEFVFENVGAALELWARSTHAQVESQLRERRRSFSHRRESIERVQVAASELEGRLLELETQEARLQALAAQARQGFVALREQAYAERACEPAADGSGAPAQAAAVIDAARGLAPAPA